MTLLDRIFPPTLRSGPFPVHLLPLLIVAYACMMPREFEFSIYTAALFPYRVALILMIPFALVQLARSPVYLSLVDVAAAFMAVWFLVALTQNHTFVFAIEPGASEAVDYFLAYLIGRAFIRTPEDVRLLIKYLIPGLLFIALVMAVESVSQRNILRPILASLLGKSVPQLPDFIRFGFMRASATFQHPIIAGTFLASLLPFAWYATHDNRFRLCAFIGAMSAVFSVSSTAFLALAVGIGMITMDIAQRISRFPVVPIFLSLLALLLGTIKLTYGGGLASFIIRFLTFDSVTGHYRLMIWDFGGAEVAAHPLFGIGLNDWLRPASMPSSTVDSFWLLIAMKYGVPALVAMSIIFIGTLGHLMRAQRIFHPADKNVSKAFLIFILAAILAGFAVHFWETIIAWIMLVIGCAVSLSTQAKVVPTPIVVAPPRRPEALRVAVLAPAA